MATEPQRIGNNRNNNNNNSNNNNSNVPLNLDMKQLSEIMQYLVNMKRLVNTLELPTEISDNSTKSKILQGFHDIAIDFNAIRKLETCSETSVQQKTLTKLWKLIQKDAQITIMEALSQVVHVVTHNDNGEIDEVKEEEVNDQDEVQEEEVNDQDDSKQKEDAVNKRKKISIPSSKFWSSEAAQEIRSKTWKKYKIGLAKMSIPNDLKSEFLEKKINAVIAKCKLDIRTVINRLLVEAKSQLTKQINKDIQDFSVEAAFDRYSFRGYYRKKIVKISKSVVNGKKMKSSGYWNDVVKATIKPKIKRMIVFVLLDYIDDKSAEILGKVPLNN